MRSLCVVLLATAAAAAPLVHSTDSSTILHRLAKRDTIPATAIAIWTVAAFVIIIKIAVGIWACYYCSKRNTIEYVQGQLYVMHRPQVGNGPQPLFLPVNALTEPNIQRYEYDGFKMVPVGQAAAGTPPFASAPAAVLSAQSAAASGTTTQPAAAFTAQRQDEKPDPEFIP
eukprot:jgi/Hompol1/3015/HPOL_003088-RA